MKQFTLKVDGMRCGMCESHVNDVVRKSGNVKKVTSSHISGTTVIVAEDDFDVNAATAAIKDCGYNVESVTEKPYEKQGFFAKLFKK